RQLDPTFIDREQPGQGGHHGRFPGTGGPEQRHRPPRQDRDIDLHSEVATSVHDEPGVEPTAHRAFHHRSRNRTSTVRDTATITRLSAIAASRTVSRATKTASGSVCVRPWTLTANVTVAANAPSALAQVRSSTAVSEGAIIGIVTRRNTVHRPAPSVAAAPSKRGSRLRSAPSSVITRNGIATNVLAMITPQIENGRTNPVASASG